jgi:hypothetical protein
MFRERVKPDTPQTTVAPVEEKAATAAELYRLLSQINAIHWGNIKLLLGAILAATLILAVIGLLN